MLALMLMLAAQDASLPKMTVTPLGNGRHIITTVPFPVSQQNDVNVEQARLAGEVCGSRPVGWGLLQRKGPIVGEAVPTYSTYSIEFQCLPRDTETYPPAPANWRPAAADESDARRVFGKYYGLLGAGKFDAAYAMFDERVVPIRESWIENERNTFTSLGSGTQRVVAVRWQVNPSDKRHPGVFATIAFEADYPAADAVCGEITLYRRGPNDYELVGEEFNFLLKGGPPMTPEELAQTKAERCPH